MKSYQEAKKRVEIHRGALVAKWSPPGVGISGEGKYPQYDGDDSGRN